MPENSTTAIINQIKSLPAMSKLEPEKYAEIEGYADKFVRDCRNLKANQLRRIFHYVKGLKREFDQSGFKRHKVSLIIPLLAYARGRDLIPGDFFELMSLCFGKQRCSTEEDFNAAVNFLEAIVAYHKYYERR